MSVIAIYRQLIRGAVLRPRLFSPSLPNTEDNNLTVVVH